MLFVTLNYDPSHLYKIIATNFNFNQTSGSSLDQRKYFSMKMICSNIIIDSNTI